MDIWYQRTPFCCSLPSSNPNDEHRLQASLDESYDHTSRIFRPWAFARALAEMVAEQYGPRGQIGSISSSFGDYRAPPRNFKSQCVFHGPVRYEDDPFELIHAQPPNERSMLLPLFLKRRKYADQKEYRFVIWGKNPPPCEVIKLNSSMAMLGTMAESRYSIAGQLARDSARDPASEVVQGRP